MFHTKIEESQQLDSGLGDSFGPDDGNTVTEVGNSLTRLDVSHTQQQQEQEEQFIKLMRQAFTPDEDNDTYLHLFIARDLQDNAIQLIELCPQKHLLNIQNDLGQTPLHLAAYVNSHKIVTKLIQHGVALDYVDKDGKNVFHLCAERGHLETLEAVIRMACQTQQIEKMKGLLNNRDFEGLTPFYLAVSNKQERICQRLAELNVDVDLSDSKSGNSPLHEAIMDPDYNEKFIQFLITKCNMNVNAQNYAGATPLHCAAGRNDASIFSTLLVLGADAGLTDIRDNTPIMYGNIEIQKLVNTS